MKKTTSRIASLFSRLRADDRKALISYITAGDPDLESTASFVRTLVDSGSDLVEIGVPFSDPLADGPTIQKACIRGLNSGVNLRRALDLVARLRREVDTPLVLLCYANPLYRYGYERFVEDAIGAGLDGLIVPDMPLEESQSLRSITEGVPLDVISFVAPTTPDVRIRQIAASARGFIYCISVRGVTGARQGISDEIKSLVDSVRKYTDTPVAIGFGISSPEQARAYAEHADGIIIGSALVRIIEELGTKANKELANFLKSIREALDKR